MNWKFWKKKKEEESTTKDLYNFLKILAKNSCGYVKRDENINLESYIKRSEKELAKIFGEEKLDNLIDLCFEQGYIRRERVGKVPKKKGFEKDFYAIRIQRKGLKYLEEFERGRRKEKNSERIMNANYILAGATIALVIITGIYAGLIYKSNQIIFSQFEAENRPYLRVENFSLIGNEFELSISNQGKLPGQIKKVIFEQEGEINLNSENKIIFSHEEINLHYSADLSLENHKLTEIKVEYYGLDGLKDNEYYTTSKVIKLNGKIILSNEEYI